MEPEAAAEKRLSYQLLQVPSAQTQRHLNKISLDTFDHVSRLLSLCYC